MRIEQMQSFLALAHHRNFTSAAESLFISQSLLSKHILSMEKELDAVLFNRSNRTVQLTPAGECIFVHVQNIVTEYDFLTNGLRNYVHTARNKISITTLYDISQYGLTEMIISFERKYPEVHAETRESNHDVMRYNLDNNISFCAIGFQELWEDTQSYRIIPLYSDPLVIVCSMRHPFATRNTFSLKDAYDQHFCFPKEDHQLFSFILDICTKAGFMPRLTLSDVRLATIREYVSRGMRLTITTRSRARHCFSADEFLIIPLDDISPLTMSIMTKFDTLTPIYEQFLAHAKEYAEKNLDAR